jgi:hypothetical protein
MHLLNCHLLKVYYKKKEQKIEKLSLLRVKTTKRMKKSFCSIFYVPKLKSRINNSDVNRLR